MEAAKYGSQVLEWPPELGRSERVQSWDGQSSESADAESGGLRGMPR